MPALMLARYAAEALLAHAYAWPLRPRTPLFWLARDLLLPVLWIQAWTVRRYEWRGNAVDVRAPPRALAGLRLRFSRLR